MNDAEAPVSNMASGDKSRKWRRIILWIVLLLILIGGPNTVFYYKWMHPKYPIPPVAKSVTDQFKSSPQAGALGYDMILNEARTQTGLPSMSAAIGYDGGVQWAGAVGYADIERHIPATVRSRYRIGSTSKALTGTVLVRLVESGQIDMDAPLSSYVSGMPAHLAPLTARQLVSHRSGVRHYSMPSWWLGWWEMNSNQSFGNVEEGLSLFRNDKLLFEPGTDFKYSTFGFSLLSRLMEGASGEDFPTLLEKSLFAPAGMRDTTVDRAGKMPQRVSFYSADSERYTPSYPTNASYKIAGGGLVSTPVDLVQLGVRILGDKFISDAGKKLLWTPVPLDDGSSNPENYAAGWRVDRSERLFGADKPTQIFHHGGVQSGGAAFYMLVPEHGIAVAVVSNSGTGVARAAAQELAYKLVRRAVRSKQAKKGEVL